MTLTAFLLPRSKSRYSQSTNDVSQTHIMMIITLCNMLHFKFIAHTSIAASHPALEELTCVPNMEDKVNSTIVQWILKAHSCIVDSHHNWPRRRYRDGTALSNIHRQQQLWHHSKQQRHSTQYSHHLNLLSSCKRSNHPPPSQSCQHERFVYHHPNTSSSTSVPSLLGRFV